jgi:uncharacterized surface protein with fasciclin (FAS1) repeats
LRKLTLITVIAAMLLFAVAPTFAQDEPGTIADVVVAAAGGDPAEFTILLAAVSAADPDVLAALSDPESSWTVFAPTDAAFAAAFEALGVAPEDVLADYGLLNAILAYHVVGGSWNAETLVGAQGDLEGYYIPTVLPDSPIWFAASDEGVMLNEEINVVTPDVAASNGTIHVIDGVLVPPALMEMAALLNEMQGMEEEMVGSVVDVASSTEGFATLVTAVGAADPAVAAILSNLNYSVTVFAPTDAAFAAVPADLLQAALADQALLTSILAYHVLPGAVTSAGVVALLEEGEGSFDVFTWAGSTVNVALDGETITVGGAPVEATDVIADNGVIHVIGAVILPPAE